MGEDRALVALPAAQDAASDRDRLLALAERQARPSDADELRAIADRLQRARAAGGRAKAAAHEAACRKSHARALAIAQAARRAEPTISQSRVAEMIKATLGALVPEPDAIRRWIRGWESSGDLSARAGKVLAADRTCGSELARLRRERSRNAPRRTTDDRADAA